ncbi:MAG: uroporphyrinogen-III C-methyltransferase [Phycisphaeraceae bacterium]
MQQESPKSPLPGVCLIGAGPGDPGLLTVKALDRLRQAQVVIYDALADPSLLAQAPPDAILIDAGKRARDHKLTQDQINQKLVEHAKTGRFVVRLKGGDPYLFGRGAEEAVYVASHGLDCEIIPGVTSGLAAPATAGIPVTHRNLASSVTLITGHETPDKPESKLDYRTLAALAIAGGTLCFYMGVGRMSAILTSLVEHNLDPATPAAVVQWGTLPRQRVARGTVSNLDKLANKAGISSPAIIVVGGVAGLDEPGLQGFIRRPLMGQRVLVTRTRVQASQLTDLLREQGAEVVEAPTIRIVPAKDPAALRAVVQRLSQVNWLALTSANAVDSLAEVMDEQGLDARSLAGLAVGVIGSSTARRLRERLSIRADVIPQESHGGALADAMQAASPQPGRALLLRADLGGVDLPDRLRQAGWEVHDAEAYQTQPVDSLPESVVNDLKAGQFDWVTLTSSSTAANLVSLLGDDAPLLSTIKRASIGPITSKTLTDLGYPPSVEATNASIDSLVRAIVRETDKKQP